MNVVLVTIGAITAILLHCSGSWPTWIAFVANPLGCSLKFAIPLLILDAADLFYYPKFTCKFISSVVQLRSQIRALDF